MEVLEEKIKDLKSTFSNLDQEVKELLYKIPNTPHDTVPAGKSEADNEIIFTNKISDWRLMACSNFLIFSKKVLSILDVICNFYL